jgi:hypothetical protein
VKHELGSVDRGFKSCGRHLIQELELECSLRAAEDVEYCKVAVDAVPPDVVRIVAGRVRHAQHDGAAIEGANAVKLNDRRSVRRPGKLLAVRSAVRRRDASAYCVARNRRSAYTYHVPGDTEPSVMAQKRRMLHRRRTRAQ